MMKKIFTIMLLTGFFIGLSFQPSLATDGWEANITVISGNAESRFSFGQRPDATDLEDGFYDVPAMLSGSIQVYSQTKEGPFWRDIRSNETGSEWQLIITSKTLKPIYLKWDPTLLPADANVKLVDASDGKETNMKDSNTYTLSNTTSEALLLIEVTHN